jgi:hypothetical protein
VEAEGTACYLLDLAVRRFAGACRDLIQVRRATILIATASLLASANAAAQGAPPPGYPPAQGAPAPGYPPPPPGFGSCWRTLGKRAMMVDASGATP